MKIYQKIVRWFCSAIDEYKQYNYAKERRKYAKKVEAIIPGEHKYPAKLHYKYPRLLWIFWGSYFLIIIVALYLFLK
jgi:hypothetical protein